ncbi:MAG TPA: Asp-tRNA(Asn)/Glu-tRNA(Gln) amidotransferase subunit GatB [Gordonia sp. (in: high G+C Gram-positive bacteria)]|uniref:Asp-tRNA(Asn)/Glu-tRNA(Gln) amidotransferase subunit GatB n=1 Tax=unclassified Gordonia (in: high G+C Gram-positive bacteria) TaxID=2657482 RepID=UPI000FB97FD1|nr:MULTISPECIES: Asp-tRNA(Asn)/Glu-tRNA(Gln) amidotransferase subunit GatB [unclassified Gordonia (in: high G+C Gram-positive bacteria)]RUP36370.1 MAG: Asp-tRNA(Asn)/Glu-tRNA(Gln) amidotransferase subunit GatB [Gordonia sp. (in: high G+C Gram-positive bacteria)]HNP58971.1 Asp-tRNA(Asn)/Glu-tRNA(Gln) amidotransferase subunit GatB [Gordonia sp. (in: high G+C Gram-positive bacteria)]HRC52675.1 Asp-tRNA(Asn)/Glu-tRNA(Gln) amidotransferase subunit GatB [Gordonia sp. (in: high G+C Gram-positive bacter
MTAPTTELMEFDDVIATYDPVLGMEVHVELGTATKMFCGCPTTFGAEPNTQVCPVCIGLPGSLPVANAAAIESAIRIGLALNCSIRPSSVFARKNYFYPDQPKNYQISQYDEPIAFDGHLDVVLADGTPWRVEIERAHMEEDTGKSLHIGGTGRIHGASHSLLDYNRAGVPLVEIVTRPITGAGERAPEVARAYVTALRDLLKALGVSDVRMDQGSLRCDANVSLMLKDAAEFGTRTETKNVNSLKSVEIAVRYEMCRQGAVLRDGGEVVQETRHFHEGDGSTSAGRRKETAEDYRYFPEPDLPPVSPDAAWIAELGQTLPELPWVRRARIQSEWGVSDEVMRDLVNVGAVDLIIATADAGASPEASRSWWVSFLAQQANSRAVELAELAISPAQVARVIALVDEGKLTNKLAQQVVVGVLDGEGEPDEVVAARGLEVVRDDSALQTAVDEALAANPDIVEKIRSGKVAAAGKIVGDVMKATRGQADPARVKELVLAACQ